ncbi:MAG TPA: outer membrane beta-barrel protein [Prolixibacteraceae bacterium]|nr:outer membrane beta-barrel protein [Prolixibacteraceae bacterium]
MKNLLKRTFIPIIFIAFHLTTFGQHQLGVKVSGGISRIYGALGTDNFSWYPNSIPTTSSSFSPSFQAGFYYLLPTGKNASLGAELLFSKVQGSQTETWDHYYNNEQVSYGTRSIYEDISYLSLPVYFGVTYRRLTINGGFQFSYLLSSSGSVRINSTQTTDINNDNPRGYLYSGERDLNNLAIKEVDFGPRAGFVYQLTNKLSMEGMFYYGLNNINLLPSSEAELKIQQMTLGIRYALGTKETVTTSPLGGNKQFGIKAGGGVSKTTNSINRLVTYTNPIGLRERYIFTTPFMASGQGGFYYTVQFGKNSYLGAELLFSQIEGNERREENYKGEILSVNGESMTMEINPFKDDIKIDYNHIRHISNISLPFYYGFKINRWSVNAGMQISYAFLVAERYQKNITVNESPYNTFYKKLDTGIVKLDVGPRAGIIYQISNQLALEANYYYGLNDLRKRELYGNNSELKVQQLNLGIRYALWSLN